MSIARPQHARATLPAGAMVVCVVTMTVALSGCYGVKEPVVAPCETISVEPVETPAIDKVDLLFMVDNSGSMAEEQASLGMELPRLVRVLSTGDRTGDGPSPDDFEPVKNLHVGVVSSDMGVGGFNVPTCTRSSMFGDDGLLRTMGNTSIAGCMATYPSFLEYIPGVSPQTPDEFGADFRCVAATGTGGCGFEQQLEATLKAVTPSTSPITFFGGTRGHGDTENAGFIRHDSVIALVLLTDEEDCSIQAGYEDIFNQMSPSYTGDLNLRCYLYKEAQWPVQRYIDGFKALRPGREGLVVFGAIAGVPLDLVTTGTPNYAAILADPRMNEHVDDSPGTTGARLVPSCNVPGRGIAFPPRRMVEVAEGFGENGIVQSICQDNFTGALDAVVAKIANAIDNICLNQTLAVDSSGLVGCDVLQVIPRPGTFAGQPTSCAELGGVNPTPVRTNADGSIECASVQLAALGGSVAPGEGWYYDDFSTATSDACGSTGRRIVFTPGATPPSGLAVNLECFAGSATRHCATDADCPLSLACDLATGVGFCRNPMCID